MTQSRLSSWLFLSLVVLAAIAAAELLYGVGSGGGSSIGPVPQTGADLPELPTASFELPDQASLSETVERPLFMANRRPAEASAQAAPQPTRQSHQPKATRYLLSAIVIVDQERVALLTDTATGSLSRVKEGERVPGWQIEEIGEDMVVLVNGGARERLPLRTFAEPPAKPRRSSRRSQPNVPSQAVPQGGAKDADVRRPRRPKRGPRQSDEVEDKQSN